MMLAKLPSWVRTISGALLVALVCAPLGTFAKDTAKKSAPARQTVAADFPGDKLLELTRPQKNSVTREAVRQRLDAVFALLDVPASTRSQFSFVDDARLQVSPGYFESTELSNAILIARGSVKIAHASNVVVIAEGNVEISQAYGVIVATSASLNIASTSSPTSRAPGFFITRKGAVFSRASRASIYAVEGADIGSYNADDSVVAYNTDLLAQGVARKLVRPPLFVGEPTRQSAPELTVMASGEVLEHEGAVCGDRPRSEQPPGLARAARREADCVSIEKVAVRCESEQKAADGTLLQYRERWSFRLCGKSVDFIVQGRGNVVSAGLDRSDSSPVGRSQVASAASSGVENRRAELFGQALSRSSAGDDRGAIAAYDAVIALQPHDWSAYNNRALIRAKLGDLNGAIVDYGEAIRLNPTNPIAYSNRSMYLLRMGNAPGALADLDKAMDLRGDMSVLTNRALVYLYSGRPDKSLLDLDRAMGGTRVAPWLYETRAWAHLLLGSSDAAYQDAFASMAEAGPWTAESYRRANASYRVLVGYLARRQMARDDKAEEWLAQWRSLLDEQRWPDSLLRYVAGGLDRQALEALAGDAQQRVEAQAFVGLDALLKGRREEARERFQWVVDNSNGYSLGRGIAERGLASNVRLR